MQAALTVQHSRLELPQICHSNQKTLIGQDLSRARKAVRASNGLRTLLGVLQNRSASGGSPAKLRALATQGLLGLAQDPDTCHTLSQLQVSVSVGLELGFKRFIA